MAMKKSSPCTEWMTLTRRPTDGATTQLRPVGLSIGRKNMDQPTLYYSVPRHSFSSSQPPVPVLISASGYLSGRGLRMTLKQPRVPAQITVRAADSGGYAAMTRWRGSYPFSPRQYVTWLTGWQPQWAAFMDMGCVDLADHRLPDPSLIQERQRWTTSMAWQMWRTYYEMPWAWTPTLHGLSP